MTDPDSALKFCRELHDRLTAGLSDVGRVRDVVCRLELHASFPETRFCKGCFLPILDQFANEYLRGAARASATEVHNALRCEGHGTLDQCYDRTGLQTQFSGTPQTKSKQPVSKRGKVPGGQACPDFCIRFFNPRLPLRMLGEAKYAGEAESKTKVVENLHHDLKYYLNITSDPLTDWGHDFGYGIGYAAGGAGPRRATLVDEYWESDRILMSVFWADS